MAGSELTPGSFVWVCERGMHGGRWGGVGGLRGGEVEVDAVGLGGRVWGVGSRRGGGGGLRGYGLLLELAGEVSVRRDCLGVLGGFQLSILGLLHTMKAVGDILSSMSFRGMSFRGDLG